MASKAWQHWTKLEDGGSGRWLWARRLSSQRFLFVAIDDALECEGKGAEVWFYGQTSLVDLAEVSAKQVSSALESIGYEPDDEPLPPLYLAQALHDYGTKAPLWDGSSARIGKSADRYSSPDERSPIFIRFAAAARNAANDFAAGDESALDRVVNGIGQTAREYARGTEGLWDRLREIKANPDAATPGQQLILRLYQRAETTLGAGPIPADLKR